MAFGGPRAGELGLQQGQLLVSAGGAAAAQAAPGLKEGVHVAPDGFPVSKVVLRVEKILEILRESPIRIAEILEGVPAARLQSQPREGGWRLSPPPTGGAPPP